MTIAYRFFIFLGLKISNFFYHTGAFSILFYRMLLALREFRTYSSLVAPQMVRIGINSMPVVLYIAAFAGMVTAVQSASQFSEYIPLYIAGTVVGKSVMQELSAVLTALVLSGRVGAAIAAEIGTMKVTEQIDALEAMAFNPIAYLVVPRVLAGVVMLPVLTVFAGAVGIVSGWLAAINLMDLTTYEFFKGLKMFFTPKDYILPLSKSVLFGLSITLVACYQGFNADRGAEGVGAAATKAAVVSSLAILLLDFAMATVILT
jgi:phospholipid/cholesterol/gamma-HCH transport system permease protein